MKHLIVTALVAALSLAMAQAPIKSTPTTPEVTAAFQETKGAVEGAIGGLLTCGRLNTFLIRGELQQAGPLAQKVLNYLEWPVVDYGQLTLSFALALANKPEDRTSIALGGLLPTEDGDTLFYLTQCHMHTGQSGQDAHR